MKTKTIVDRAAGNVVNNGRPAKGGRAAARTAAEHTKLPDARSVIRATEGKRWTARQQGRG